MARPKTITPAQIEKIKAFYKKGVVGRGYVATALKLKLSNSIVRYALNTHYVKNHSNYMSERYRRLRKAGICPQCGQSLPNKQAQ